VIAVALLALFVNEAVVAREFVGGVDFYQDVVVSRDLANGVRDIPDARYEHLPGLQHFWRAAIVLFGGSLASLQWTYLAVVALDLLLVGALALRLGASPEAALLAVAWMFTLDGKLQLYLACGERVAILPCLLGLLAWSGRPLRGRDGLLRAVALGVGLGLGVYMKRQAGLVALGAAALLPPRFLSPGQGAGEPEPKATAPHAAEQGAGEPEPKATAPHAAEQGAGEPEPKATAPHAEERPSPEWRALVAIPVAALTVLVGAVLLEGRGLEPFRLALGALARYRSYGSPLENELIIIRQCPALLVGPALLLVWLNAVARRRIPAAELPFLGFAAIAASAAFLQFTKRPYAHHGLLATPFLALGAVRFGQVFLDVEPAVARPLVLALALFLGAPLEHARFGPADLEHPWPADEATRAEVLAVARHVRPGEDVLLLPPEGRNELHYILGTTARSNPVGYDWAPELGLTLEGVRWPTVDAVIVLRPRSDYDLLHWMSFDCNAVVASLEGRGFAPVFSGTVLTVYRRKSG
jgi:hypothetical protein